MNKIQTRLQRQNVVKVPKLMEAASVLLPICGLWLWAFSLQYVNIRAMTDLGLISVLPASTIFALVILTISFYLALQQAELRVPIILLHFFLLIFMLYGITTLVEEAPRFDVVYSHAGYTEYIMRTGSVDPDLAAYFNWPGFFVLSAFVTQIVGYHDIFPFAAWASVFFNLIYFGPLYVIFTSATTDQRLVWSGLWFFYVTNWIGQDYFAPQAFDFFLYLVIIAILLRWFKVTKRAQSLRSKQLWQRPGLFSPLIQQFYTWLTTPDTICTPSQPRQRIALHVGLVIIFAFIVFSHPLTPFFVLVSVTALVIFRRCTPRWLPILMAAMTGAWIIFMARPFLVGHLSMMMGDLGQIGNAITTNVTARVGQGSPQHIFISTMRLIMTAVLWLLAFIGAVRRLRRGYCDVTYILLAIAPFSLAIANSYDGEILLRIYLFTLPLMVFFAVASFYPTSTSGKSRWMTVAVAATSIVLLGAFLFIRYGNERMDYKTYAEVDGARYLYNIAPPNSLFIAGWDDSPLQFQDIDKYNYISLSSLPPNTVTTQNIHAIVQLIKSKKHSNAYLIFMRSQKAAGELYSGMPSGAMERLEAALLNSGKFTLLYSNSDAQIFEYLQ